METTDEIPLIESISPEAIGVRNILRELARPQHAVVDLSDRIVALATEAHRVFDEAHPHWVDDERRKESMRCNAYICAAIIELLQERYSVFYKDEIPCPFIAKQEEETNNESGS
jgi:hypothetical protein